jgi:transposase-like protein
MTIYNWIKRYIPVISEYVNSLTPQLSDTWHADEIFVKMHGGLTYKGKTNLAFLWNVMDRDTRFLLASKISEARDINGAVAVFKEAIKNANGSKPEKVLTDSWRAYRQGISETFKTEHVAKCGIGKPHANNNRIERLNGTLRERIKVQSMEETYFTNGGRSEDTIQLCQASYGFGRKDSGTNSWSRNKG